MRSNVKIAILVGRQDQSIQEKTKCGIPSSCVQIVAHPTGYNAVKTPQTPTKQAPVKPCQYLLTRTQQVSHIDTHQSFFQTQGEPPSSSLISCCSTMEYTLAFSRVKTVAVLRSRPRNESKISTEGFAASSARIPESYNKVSVLSFAGFVGKFRSRTLSRLPTNLAYSSRTSCSSGLSSGSFSWAYRFESIDDSMIAV
jgi:hypothetical protein